MPGAARQSSEGKRRQPAGRTASRPPEEARSPAEHPHPTTGPARRAPPAARTAGVRPSCQHRIRLRTRSAPARRRHRTTGRVEFAPRDLAIVPRRFGSTTRIRAGPDAGPRAGRRRPATLLAQEAKAQIEATGTLKHENNWGLRKMAYEIDQRNEADYRWFRFEAPTELLDELDHNLKIADGVLRFRIFKVDADSPVMVPPADRPPRPRRLARAAIGARGARQRRRPRPPPSCRRRGAAAEPPSPSLAEPSPRPRPPSPPSPRPPSPPPSRDSAEAPDGPPRASPGDSRLRLCAQIAGFRGESRAARALRLESRQAISEE